MMDSILDTEPQRMMDYSRTGVNECPACGSDLFGTVGISFPSGISLGEIWRNSDCKMCSATWKEIYQLVDIQNLSVDTQSLTT